MRQLDGFHRNFTPLRLQVRPGNFDGPGVEQGPFHRRPALLIEQCNHNGFAFDRVELDGFKPVKEGVIAGENSFLQRNIARFLQTWHFHGKVDRLSTTAVRDGLRLYVQPGDFLKRSAFERFALDSEIEFW